MTNNKKGFWHLHMKVETNMRGERGSGKYSNRESSRIPFPIKFSRFTDVQSFITSLCDLEVLSFPNLTVHILHLSLLEITATIGLTSNKHKNNENQTRVEPIVLNRDDVIFHHPRLVLNRAVCSSNDSMVQSSALSLFGQESTSGGKLSQRNNQHQDLHTPKNAFFSGMLTDGAHSLLPSGCLQLFLANQGLATSTVNDTTPLRLNQPAVGVLQVCVQHLVFIQRLWGSEGQLT